MFKFTNNGYKIKIVGEDEELSLSMKFNQGSNLNFKEIGFRSQEVELSSIEKLEMGSFNYKDEL
jgi:hypothetical protein